MKPRSQLWDAIAADDSHWAEVKISLPPETQGETPTEYGIDKIKALSIYQPLIPKRVPTIGGAVSCKCELTVMEDSDNWPRMARFDVLGRLHSEDDSQISEWLNLGTFYTDERAQTDNGDLIIVAYDGMLLYEQSWTDKLGEYTPSSWPITAYAWASIMETIGIFELETGTVLDNTVGLVGLNTVSTVRDVLKTIAAAHGGNWVITPQGKLRLIPFSNMNIGTAAIAGIAIAGVAVVGNDEFDDVAENADYTYVGMSVMSLETGPAFAAVTGVQLETEGGALARAGTTDGYVLKADCEFSDSEGVAELCLSHLQGYVYKPFEATGAYMNLAADVGDLVIVGGDTFQMMTVEWTFSTKPTADISAPYEEEVDHEYTILAPQAKTLRKALAANEDLEARVYSSIEQTATDITMQVGEIYETKGDAEQKYETIQTTVQQTKDALEIEVQSVTEDLDELRMHYRFDDEGETIGREGSPKTITLNNEEIDINVNNDPMVIINIDEMVAPRSVRIPTGGNLIVGNVIWLPRSNGNMSEMWVGE